MLEKLATSGNWSNIFNENTAAKFSGVCMDSAQVLDESIYRVQEPLTRDQIDNLYPDELEKWNQ